MTEQTAWFAAIAAVLVAALIGFFIGRRCGSGKARIEELEAEIQRQKDETEAYRKEVAGHFEGTAALFVSMADSYKELIEHMSSGYEKLSLGSARALFQQRVDALLVSSARDADEEGKLLAGAGAVAATATVADAAAAEAAGAVASGAVASDADTPSGAPDAAGTAEATAAPEELTATQADALAESAGAVSSDQAPEQRDLAAEAYRNEGAQAGDPLSEALSGEGAGQRAEPRRDDTN